MARLFWVGLGAVGAVVLTRKLREQARRYTPDGVAERVEAAGEQAGLAVTGAVRRFRTARAERERDLVSTLLVTPEGGDPHAVIRRGGAARPQARVDPDEPLYEF